jgi:hypothetical protein
MSSEDEEVYVRGLASEERHAVSGLGGSQKAEVAWLDKHGIPYKEVDVRDFIISGSTGDTRTKSKLLGKVPAKSSLKIVPINPTQDEEENDVSEEEMDVEEVVKNVVEDELEDMDVEEETLRVCSYSDAEDNEL